MDRIFLNTQTKEILISAADGFMPISPEWIQIGTIDVTKLTHIENFEGRIEIS
jgi:hypothetical protein